MYICTTCGKASEEPLGAEHDAECSGQAKADSGIIATQVAARAVELLRKLTATHSQFDVDVAEARAFLRELDG